MQIPFTIFTDAAPQATTAAAGKGQYTVEQVIEAGATEFSDLMVALAGGVDPADVKNVTPAMVGQTLASVGGLPLQTPQASVDGGAGDRSASPEQGPSTIVRSGPSVGLLAGEPETLPREAKTAGWLFPSQVKVEQRQMPDRVPGARSETGPLATADPEASREPASLAPESEAQPETSGARPMSDESPRPKATEATMTATGRREQVPPDIAPRGAPFGQEEGQEVKQTASADQTSHSEDTRAFAADPHHISDAEPAVRTGGDTIIDAPRSARTPSETDPAGFETRGRTGRGHVAHDDTAPARPTESEAPLPPRPQAQQSGLALTEEKTVHDPRGRDAPRTPGTSALPPGAPQLDRVRDNPAGAVAVVGSTQAPTLTVATERAGQALAAMAPPLPDAALPKLDSASTPVEVVRRDGLTVAKPPPLPEGTGLPQALQPKPVHSGESVGALSRGIEPGLRDRVTPDTVQAPASPSVAEAAPVKPTAAPPAPTETPASGPAGTRHESVREFPLSSAVDGSDTGTWVATSRQAATAYVVPAMAQAGFSGSGLPGPFTSSAREVADPALVQDHEALPFSDRGTPDAPSRTEATRPTMAEPARPIAFQIAEALRSASGSVEVALSPEELGRVSLTLSSQDGTLTVQLAAERPETLDLLRRHIDILSQEARAAGFADVDFGFSDQRGFENQSHSQGAAFTTQPIDGSDMDSTEIVVRPGDEQLLPSGSGLDLRL